MGLEDFGFSKVNVGLLSCSYADVHENIYIKRRHKMDGLQPLCISYCSHCYDKGPDRSDVEKEGFCLIVEGEHGKAMKEHEQLAAVPRQSGGREPLCWLPPFLFSLEP